jgi:hypothetical protein
MTTPRFIIATPFAAAANSGVQSSSNGICGQTEGGSRISRELTRRPAPASTKSRGPSGPGSTGRPICLRCRIASSVAMASVAAYQNCFAPCSEPG